MTKGNEFRQFGWKRDLPDFRDVKLDHTTLGVETLPASVDMRKQCPAVYDQGDLGSCTANALAAALEFDLIKQKETPWVPSRLFIYYNERVMEGTVGQDAGASIRDGAKSINVQGACPEWRWPYDETKFTVLPSTICYAMAEYHESVHYSSPAQTEVALKTVLAGGLPVVFGFTVYESFEDISVSQTGVVPMPGPNETVLGGHAVMLVGYDDSKKMFLVRNSWGTSWGLKGYFWMPYDYVTNSGLADDFWVIQLIK